MNKKIVGRIRKVALFLVIITIVAFATYYYINVYNRPEDPNLLKTSGVIEAVEVRVGTKIGGVIDELAVEEGDQVAAGQVVARIETTDLNIQLEGAGAAVEQAKALLADIKRGLRAEEIEQLETIAKLKKANLERVEIDYNKKKALAEKDALPKHEAEMAQKLVEAAQKDYESALELVKIAKLGSREDQIKAAEFSLERAKTSVAQLEQRISEGTIFSPIEGRVSVKNMELGEIAAPGGTIITLVDLERPWVRVFVPENKLGRIRLGMTAEIYSDSFPDKVYKGVIRHIATEAEFTPKNVQTQEERVKLVYAVKVYVDNPNQELKPGQLVDAYIRLDQ
jgi:HlyD family secretion protein